MRRLLLLSLLIVLAGILLLLPSSALYNLITTGSASGSIETRFAAVSGTTSDSTYEALIGLGLVIVGAILEFFSIFTEVGPTAPAVPMPQPEENKL